MLHDVQNEAFAEQLRERVRLFGEKDRKLDFFLVSEPTWLDTMFPQEAKRVGRPCVALVSTDKIWITCAATLCCSGHHTVTCSCCEDLHASQPRCHTPQAMAHTASCLKPIICSCLDLSSSLVKSTAIMACHCRFMKLRLDRVMKLELGEMTPEKALDSGAPVPEFPPLDRTKWTAPYSPYKPGWWKAFEPDTFFKQ